LDEDGEFWLFALKHAGAKSILTNNILQTMLHFLKLKCCNGMTHPMARSVIIEFPLEDLDPDRKTI